MKTYRFFYFDLFRKLGLILTLFLLFFSCQQDEIELIEPDISSFLSINGDMEDPDTYLVPENIGKYNEAFQRVLAVSVQNGESVEFKVNNGSEINIAENMFLKISRTINESINSKKMIIVRKNGENLLLRKMPITNIKRLKSGTWEEDSYFRWRLDGNIPQDIMNGMKAYSSSIHGNINDIWDLSSGNFQAQNYYTMGGYFTYMGETFYYFMSNGCGNSGTNNNSCSMNDISSNYSYQESGGSYFFVLQGAATQTPIVTIKAYTNTGYNIMRNFIGW